MASLNFASSQDVPDVSSPTPLASCQPAVANFIGGKPPYILRIVSANGTVVLHQYQNLSSSPYQWTVEEQPNTEVRLNITDSQGATTLSSGYYTVRASNETSCLAKGDEGGPETRNIFLGSVRAQTIFIAAWVCFGALLLILTTWWCIRSRRISKRTASDNESVYAGFLDNTPDRIEGRRSLESIRGVGGFAYYCRSLLSRGSSTARRSVLRTPGPPPGSPPTTIYSMPPPDYESLSPIAVVPPAFEGIPRDIEKL